jgi:hypothetical protein
VDVAAEAVGIGKIPVRELVHLVVADADLRVAGGIVGDVRGQRTRIGLLHEVERGECGPQAKGFLRRRPQLQRGHE